MAKELRGDAHIHAVLAPPGRALVAAGLLSRGAVAAGGRVDPDSATARALGYRPDGGATARLATSQRCGRCAHFAGGAEWAPCAISQGCEVDASGWCQAFTAR